VDEGVVDGVYIGGLVLLGWLGLDVSEGACGKEIVHSHLWRMHVQDGDDDDDDDASMTL
jgi:hypothetical protein